MAAGAPALSLGDGRRLLPGGVFVDIGANVGYYTLLAARRVGREGRVIAFEPNPVSLKVLLLNTAPEGDTIRVYPFTVSDRRGFLSHSCGSCRSPRRSAWPKRSSGIRAMSP
jgi:FkbM family methyltransferase